MSGLVRTTPPATTPVTLAHVQEHLHLLTLDTQTQTYLTSLIARATDSFERDTGRALIEQVWTLTLDDFPDGTIQIPRPPLLSVASLKYYDSDGVQQTYSTDDYRVHTAGLFGILEPVDAWPTADDRLNAVEVVFTAGYGDEATDVPDSQQQGILILIAHWYFNRETVSPVSLMPIPRTVQDIIYQHKAEV